MVEAHTADDSFAAAKKTAAALRRARNATDAVRRNAAADRAEAHIQHLTGRDRDLAHRAVTEVRDHPHAAVVGDAIRRLE